jgi:squalene-hopene/tetraprenyl-beta-curcumene cyclase
MTVMACRAEPEPGAAWTNQAQTAMLRGLDWLKGRQKKNGAWSLEFFPALTGLPLWAFARSPHPDRAAVGGRAAAFVAGFAQPDGGLYRPAGLIPYTGGLATYNTAICMTALHRFDAATYAPLVLKARSFVASSQLVGDSPGEGGFGYDRPREGKPGRADLSNTGWALMALRATQGAEDLRPVGEPKAEVDWVAAQKFLARLQTQDASDPDNHGGFHYEGTGERGRPAVRGGKVMLRSYGSMTYAGLESLVYAQADRGDPRVRSAIDWAAHHWTVEENPGNELKGLFYYYCVMAKSLSHATGETIPAADGTRIDWRRDLALKLASTQRADGSWVNSDGTFWESNPVLATSFAVLALENVLYGATP